MHDHTLRVVVAEDEAPAREELRHLLEGRRDVEIAGMAGDGIEALEMIRRVKPDLVLLDVEMPGLNGMEVAKTVLTERLSPRLIFTTAYGHFAVDAFEVDAVDYLLKPIRREKLDRALERAAGEISAAAHGHGASSAPAERYANRECPSRFLSVFRGERIIPIKIASIHFAEAKGRFVWVTTDEGEFETPLSFHEAEARLAEPEFFCCHRSFIIRPESVESIDLWVNSSYRLKMRGSDVPVPVSRSRKESFQRIMGL